MRHGTIKELVFDFVKRSGGKVDKDALAKEVLKHFPDSAWKDTHWAWYKNQITKGNLKDEFDMYVDGEVTLVRPAKKQGSHEPAVIRSENSGRRGPLPEDERIKKLGDQVLKHTREAINFASGGDMTLKFKINRWVYARLQLDERKIKENIKDLIWTVGNKKCAKCGKGFETVKGVELHRINASEVYSIDNCQLVCKPCHMAIGE
jgi:hypothetical protein